MSGRFPPDTTRSKDAPMDYQWTNRSPVKPAWAAPGDEPNKRRKRSHDALNPPLLHTPQPTFGMNQNIPFLFQPPPAPQTLQPHPWTPPPQFSPSKAFPLPTEVKDIDMTETKNDEASNGTNESKDQDSSRRVATGGLRRVFKQRDKRQESRPIARQEDEKPVTQTTSHHYTLNMPAPPPPPSDLPYVLLGCLQFFFNLSMILIFLYLLVQSIITVQGDIGHKVAEYQQDGIQEIDMCATQYRDNLCAINPIPAMVQQCANWKTCMNRDPTVVTRAKVAAEFIAEVINGFVEPISGKTLIFTLTLLAFLTVFINTLPFLYRSKHQPISDPLHNPPPQFSIPPVASFPQNTQRRLVGDEI